jgi:hypothetical protein
MIDTFVVLTPFLLLAVIALLGFAGCDGFYGLSHQDPHTSPVKHVTTTVKTAPAGTNNVKADPLTLEGGELLIVTVQWRSGSAQQPVPVLSGGNFVAVAQGGPFDWNGMKVETFVATNAPDNTSVTVEAVLLGGSNLTWNLCVSAYSSYDTSTPLFSPQITSPTFVGTNPQLAAISIESGDLIYAVVFAADNDGTFPGRDFISAGLTFEAGAANNNPMIQDGGGGDSVTVQATISGPDPNPRAFIFAMGIKAATIFS